MSTIETIDWCLAFDTGIPEIDLQHRILINKFNGISSRLRNGGDLTGWEHAAYEVLSYALYHFSTEEKLAERYGYDREAVAEALSHKEDHQSFTQYIEQVRDRLQSGKHVPPGELLHFAGDWLLKHIAHSDHQLGAFINAKQKAGL